MEFLDKIFKINVVEKGPRTKRDIIVGLKKLPENINIDTNFKQAFEFFKRQCPDYQANLEDLKKDKAGGVAVAVDYKDETGKAEVRFCGPFMSEAQRGEVDPELNYIDNLVPSITMNLGNVETFFNLVLKFKQAGLYISAKTTREYSREWKGLLKQKLGA